MTISNIRAALGACKTNVSAKARNAAKTIESWGHECVRMAQDSAVSMPAISGFDRQESTFSARLYAVELHGPPF